MDSTGYVLAGGRSLRMGRDKALLPWAGGPLVQHVAGVLGTVARGVTLVGDPARYGELGFPVIPDLHPGCGPLGGVEAALSDTATEWSLIVACDMPELTADFFLRLLDAAGRSDVQVVMPTGPGGRPEPLCAAWNRSARPAVGGAIADGVRRMTDILPRVSHIFLPVADEFHFRNLNTPEDWVTHAAR